MITWWGGPHDGDEVELTAEEELPEGTELGVIYGLDLINGKWYAVWHE